ncbi:MAG TPA: hypothetical protein VIA45_07270 [Thermoanaerobaculia bacterium]|jgi:hypothetical protein
MLRDSSLAFLIALILGISLFFRVSGFAYVALVLATLLLSLLLVRQKPADRGDSRGGGGEVRSFPARSERPAGNVRSA